MTRLVFCDLDGTLLPAGRDRLEKDILSEIKRLTDKGIHVCVASGRPYSQLKALFGELYRRIIFICLDGALIMKENCVLAKSPLPHPENLINGRATLFFRGGEKELAEGLSSQRIMEEINKAGGEILKVALMGKPAAAGSARLCYQNGGIYEYVALGTDKGSAARQLCEKLRIDLADTTALGDGENDVPLLRLVGKPFRTPVSHPSLIDMGIAEKTAKDFLAML